MGFKVGNRELAADELAGRMKELGVELPEALDFPCTYKLNDKFAVHYDRKGFVLRDGAYVPAYSETITQNKVVLLEKGE